MEQIKIIQLKKTILEDNDRDADRLREELEAEGTFYLNVMSSPGAGKTSTILKTVERLKEKYQIGVMEADIDSDVDARRIQEAGISAVQLHTGGMCHLDAQMSRQGLKSIGSENLDLVILENVGNLVCPAEFDTGAHRNVVILSVPEGDDKPLKYPLMFEKCDVALINKMDAVSAFDFDWDRVKRWISGRNQNAAVYPVSAATGEGMEDWCGWLEKEIEQWRKGIEA